MKMSLWKRMLLYFSAVLVLFSLLMGTVFTLLFARHSQEVHQEEMQKRAVALAAAIPSMSEANGWLQADGYRAEGMLRHGRGHGHQGMMQNGGWCRRQYSEDKSFFRQLNELGDGEVWLVSADSRMIRSYGTQSGDTMTELPKEAEELIDAALRGEAVHSQAFSALLGTPSITVAAPVYTDGGIKGVVLLHHSLKNMEKILWQGLQTLGISLLLALALTVGIAFALTRRFLRPLLQMQKTARAYAGGDYTARTGIVQQDEIGLLAKDIDALGAELEQARCERQDLQRQRQEFLAAISHELRTPLTIMRGTLEILWQDMAKTPEQEERCRQQALTSLSAMEALVRDLLELTRLQNPGFKLIMEPMDVTEAFREAVQQAQVLADRKDIRIKADFTEPLPLTGDYGRCRQLLLILLDNAVKFSPAGELVTVSQRRKDSGWELVVEDNGCGIAPADLPHIFTKFHRSHNEDNKQGTGLGLAIAREIAQRHGWRLACESQLGKGSRFIITQA